MATELIIAEVAGEGADDVTISAWMVNEGDQVNEGDVILEVATDKVDQEIESPVSGTVLKILYGEGEIAPTTVAVAVIGEPGEQVETGSAAAPQESAPQEESDDAEADTGSLTAQSPTTPTPAEGGKATPVAQRVAADKGVSLAGITGTGPGGQITKNDVLSAAKAGDGSAPEALPGRLAQVPALAVQRLAADHNVNLEDVAGDRPMSTLTRYDVLNFIESRDTGTEVTVEPRFLPPREAPRKAAATSAPAAAGTADKTERPAKAAEKSKAPVQPGAGEEFIKHTRMRAAIAKNTSSSLFSAPHVTTMWDVAMANVIAHRKANKKEFAKQGVNLTITAYFIAAIVDGLRAVPAANASWSDEGVTIKRTYNIGMATALPMDEYGMGGLIVPVIKNAGEMNLLGIARQVNELAERARAGRLTADDLAGGTFTLSNYGTSGSRFQTPVIVQPQVGILGVGAIEKRPVVVSQGHPLEANTGDYMAFLPMTTLGFSYDHRVLDGATADAFCAAVKQALESWSA
ncbi:MAG: 2-oxo acid dehydrogenase subunit E2 [Caldilineaceae bacterium]|nr:2-oxo acid dehydrogenase subunit E2 [Caldilineaceae bacterium]